MMKKLKIHLPLNSEVQTITTLLDGDLFVVGGVVRDKLFEHFHGHSFNPKDIDIATSAHPDTVLEKLNSTKAKSLKIQTLEIGKSFGVVAAVFPSGNVYEIATFRNEWYCPETGDGRRPDKVEFSTAKEDAQRRDLTINGLFYDIQAGEVIDYVGGISDIERKIVRPVGDPAQRYQEDRLRVLRTIRFLCRYQEVDDVRASLDIRTLIAIEKWMNLPGVSGERIVAEFQSGLKQAIHPQQYLTSLMLLDLLPAMFPGLEYCPDMVMETDSRNTNIVLTKIFPDVSPKNLAKKLIELKYDGSTSHKVKFLSSLFAFDPQDVYSYLKSRDRFCEPMIEDVRELCDCTGLDREEMERLMSFVPTVNAASFPDLEEGPLLGQAIREGITKEYAALVG